MNNPIKGKGNNMKVIGFVRVSTGHQKLSIDNQTAEITDYCKKTDGLELVDILQEENVSGGSIERTGFTKMLEMVENKEIDGIVCLNLSRIGRKASMTLDLINKCLDNDVFIYDMKDGTDTRTPGGRMSVKMRSVIYEEELLSIRENIRQVIRYKKKNGLKYNGRVQYGYYDKNGILYKDDFEMKIVRNIKNLRSRGHSWYGIAKRLNEYGIDTKERGEKGWRGQQVKNVYNYHYGDNVKVMNTMSM
jgi:DNA invertase Pin-like site-specific DNA recombinase|tara:strand:+ start:447 stop:1187 length:741 start_codon:yes stop_codon:yes gene_type:complete